MLAWFVPPIVTAVLVTPVFALALYQLSALPLRSKRTPLLAPTMNSNAQRAVAVVSYLTTTTAR
jgi:hypothetical protein